jgi:hypothetical protein
MIFAAPWLLLALPALPLLWWLLRVTPPAPRSETFPAIRLLAGLRAEEETPARTPWWLLALRMLAATLLILGLAQPVLDARGLAGGDGPVLLVIDNGWAAAADWPRRMEAAGAVLDRAARAGRKVALLATAPPADGTGIVITAPLPAAELRPRVAALAPLPWPPDRAAAEAALRGWHQGGGSVAYIADGLTDGGGFPAFAAALAAAGPVAEICCALTPQRVLLPPRAEADRLVARVAQPPQPVAATTAVLAQSGDGRTLARAEIRLAAGAATAEAPIALPPELRNRLSRLVLEGPPSAASVALLDERWRRRPVGLVAGNKSTADTPLTGQLFFLHRALAPYAELREGSIETLLRRDISVIVLADHPLPEGADRTALASWVEKGGLLVRFAGPETATNPDPLLPERLLDGDRTLGGALSWDKPAGLAPFPPGSPFAGLAIPAEVKVTRQVLAQPSASLAAHTWAQLADGTPLVTESPRGDGRIVLFHVTANADWSNLPLSGLFVEMLRRLVALSAGVRSAPGDAVLAPAETLDGYGTAGPPPPAATGLKSSEFDTTPASPRHPPGLYGSEAERRVLNLATALPPPEAAPMVPGASVERLGAARRERAIGPWLLAGALALFALDLLLALRLRGLLGARAAAALLLAALLLPHPAAAAGEPAGAAALTTRLAYIETGDPSVDDISRAGLSGLSDYVNARTAATLAEPDPVVPGETDLSFYPLLYWPITPDAAPLTDKAVAALNDYMSRGGIILIDTRDAASGTDLAPGGSEALKRVTAGLNIPALAPLTSAHVIAHAFYLLQDFPGRFTGGTVWVARDQDRSNDSVSPVIIGGNDWAAAWVVQPDGRHPYATIPGGERQRTMAYRFGVNLVMYALTGNYKGDQVHVPAILERLGQ